MIHDNYNKLNDNERALVDNAFGEIFEMAKVRKIPLRGDDEAEKAVEALATLVVNSR